MPWVNYHSHSNFCDGSEIPEAYVKEALKKGFPAYGYSSHAPLPFDTVWSIPENKFEAYLSEINRIKKEYKDKIQVYLGLETDFIPGITGTKIVLSENIKTDYSISSVHFIDRFANGDHWSFDGSVETFDKGFKQIFHSNGKEMITRYFELVRQMINEDTPEIIGHLDKIKMHNAYYNYLDESDSWYKREVDETLKMIKESDAIVEVNTRGYYKSNRMELLYPAVWILEKMRQKDIRIMINADTHRPGEVDAGIADVAGVLRKIGFEYTWALIDGKWNAYRFDRNGITVN